MRSGIAQLHVILTLHTSFDPTFLWSWAAPTNTEWRQWTRIFLFSLSARRRNIARMLFEIRRTLNQIIHRALQQSPSHWQSLTLTASKLPIIEIASHRKSPITIIEIANRRKLSIIDQIQAIIKRAENHGYQSPMIIHSHDPRVERTDQFEIGGLLHTRIDLFSNRN